MIVIFWFIYEKFLNNLLIWKSAYIKQYIKLQKQKIDDYTFDIYNDILVTIKL